MLSLALALALTARDPAGPSLDSRADGAEESSPATDDSAAESPNDAPPEETPPEEPARRANEVPRFDASHVVLRFASALHVTEVPRVLDLCARHYKRCTTFGSIDRADLHGERDVTTGSLELAALPLAIGPLRAGLEMQFGLGSGPSGGPAGASSTWMRTAFGCPLGIRIGGAHWLAFADVMPGFVVISASTSTTGVDNSEATATRVTLAARAGLGVRASKSIAVTAFGGRSVGLADDTYGLRVEIEQ